MRSLGKWKRSGTDAEWSKLLRSIGLIPDPDPEELGATAWAYCVRCDRTVHGRLALHPGSRSLLGTLLCSQADQRTMRELRPIEGHPYVAPSRVREHRDEAITSGPEGLGAQPRERIPAPTFLVPGARITEQGRILGQAVVRRQVHAIRDGGQRARSRTGCAR
jgi:hypothetical protein